MEFSWECSYSLGWTVGYATKGLYNMIHESTTNRRLARKQTLI